MRLLPRVVFLEDGEKFFEGDSGVAVRKLRETPEGCAALVREWKSLRAPLLGPVPHWDFDDACRVEALLGNAGVDRGAPSILTLPTGWIVNHRTVEHRLSENRWPKAKIDVRYFTEDERKKDEWMIENLREGAKAGLEWIAIVINAEIEHLGELKARLEADDAIDLDQAALRARVDTGEEGRLLLRYQAEAERSLLKVAATLDARSKVCQSQFVSDNSVVTTRPAEAASEAPAPAVEGSPNEATEGASAGAERPAPGVEIGAEVPVRVADRRPTDPPDLK